MACLIKHTVEKATAMLIGVNQSPNLLLKIGVSTLRLISTGQFMQNNVPVLQLIVKSANRYSLIKTMSKNIFITHEESFFPFHKAVFVIFSLVASKESLNVASSFYCEVVKAEFKVNESTVNS